LCIQHANRVNRDAPDEVVAEAMVEIDSGRLKGLRRQDGWAFLGIPYAADTAGERRFGAPQPPPRWAGEREATALGPRCPQTIENIVELPMFAWYGQDGPFGEDCCVLNVFTPGLQRDARRPVIVYLHGGGWASGGGGGPALDGGRLAAFGDAVVVTLNHRLNVFGYMPLGALSPLGDERFADAGHAGQLDIVAALQWVRRNIGAFGGDAACVTVMGQSGGGNKLMALLAMPAGRGLFHRAINLSGVSGLQLAAPQDTLPYVHEFLRRLDIGVGDLARLRSAPVDALHRARQEAMVAVRGDGGQPVVDGRHIVASPFSAQGLALQASVPLLMGSTDTESTLFLCRDPRNRGIDEAGLLARIEAEFGMDRAQAWALTEAYREQDDVRSPTQVLVQLTSDLLTRTHLIRAAEAKAQAGAAPVYFYNFAWPVRGDGGRWGSPHTADIPFVFGTLEAARCLTEPNPTEADDLSRRMMGAIVAFARSGDPNHDGLPSWAPYDARRRPTMVFDRRCRVVDDHRAAGRIASATLAAWPATRLLRRPLFRGVG
jgi:para-nitrobenzyl esterase